MSVVSRIFLFALGVASADTRRLLRSFKRATRVELKGIEDERGLAASARAAKRGLVVRLVG
ncbi:MAG: hypothetical protein ACXVRS_01325 [Gaiellaceae bacterium]